MTQFRTPQRATFLLGLASVLVGSLAFAQPVAPEPPPPVEPWYEALQFAAFVDGYTSFNFNLPPSVEEANTLRVNDQSNGFALSWAGADVGAEPDPVGGHIGVRFGPLAHSLCGDGRSEDCYRPGLDTLAQAFASWRPGGRGGPVRVDFGKFTTPYGLEVAESQDNMNYTRGLLFSLLAPSFHTGFRVDYEPADRLVLRAVAVNGWNNSLDANPEKTFGLQAQYGPTHAWLLRLGWLGGAEESSQAVHWRQLGAWRHLLDAVAEYHPFETLRLVFSAAGIQDELTVEPELVGVQPGVQKVRYCGALLGAQQELSSLWALAARVEAVADPQGAATDTRDAVLGSATLTLQATPTDSLIVRLEHRGDFMLSSEGSRRVFPSQGGPRSNQFTSTLGVVVTAD
jgi:hypothetical protein